MTELYPQLLIAAYCQGVFPMADNGVIGWYDPNPRAILPLDAFRIPRRLARTVRSGRFEIRVDYNFCAVIEACASPALGRETTWISAEIIRAYIQLYELGFAHSVETWREGKLVGGLYGVAVRGLFAGESMFTYERDASKVALVYLVERLQQSGFRLLDSQYIVNDHLRQFGVVEISRTEYKALLAQALQISAVF